MKLFFILVMCSLSSFMIVDQIVMGQETTGGETTTTTATQTQSNINAQQQEKVEQVQQEVQSQGQQVDIATIAAGGTAAGAILTFVNSFLQGKKHTKKEIELKEEDRRTDQDVGLSHLYLYRLVQTMDAMIPEVSRCLDQPFDVDPMNKDMTIRRKLAEDAAEWAIYLRTSLNAPVPSMTPSAQVIMKESVKESKPQPNPSPSPSSTEVST